MTLCSSHRLEAGAGVQAEPLMVWGLQRQWVHRWSGGGEQRAGLSVSLLSGYSLGRGSGPIWFGLHRKKWAPLSKSADVFRSPSFTCK